MELNKATICAALDVLERAVRDAADVDVLARFERVRDGDARVIDRLVDYRDFLDSLLLDDDGAKDAYERTAQLLIALHHSEIATRLTRNLSDYVATRRTLPAMENVLHDMSCIKNAMDESSISKYQQLLLFLLDTAQSHGYAKHDAMLYERVRDRRTGRTTSAWKQVSTIHEFVYNAVNRDRNFEQWLNMTSQANNAPNAISFLQRCVDRKLPSIEKDRHLFGFADGLYVTTEDAFYPHDAIPPRYTNHATAKYFDVDFPARAASYQDVDTPHMQSMFDYQDFSEEVSFFAMAFLGRLLYAVSELDNFQVIPFFIGKAQSGKSTLLVHVAAKFFEAEDVGVLSNNTERTFGLSGFVDKYMFIAPEVNEHMKLDQAEFQSVVAGDMMQVAQKHVTSRTVKWGVPGILAGNQVPAWKDTAGSILRRVVTFRFTKTVTHVDTTLPSKLLDELPKSLVKCNKAYLECVRRMQGKSLQEGLPRYFKDTQLELHDQINPVQGFLNSGALAFHGRLYMPWENFVAKFKRYCEDNSVPHTGLGKRHEDTYKSTLEAFGCRKTGKETRRYPRDRFGQNVSTVFLIGADDCDETELDECED
jgi:hypothetical protein